MQVFSLDRFGVKPLAPQIVTGKSGSGFAFTHGPEDYLTGAVVRIPLGREDYPVPRDLTTDNTAAVQRRAAQLLNENFSLVRLNKADTNNQPMHILVQGREDGEQMILWNLKYPGLETWKFSGDCEGLAQGHERMGAFTIPYPILRVRGRACLEWSFTLPSGLQRIRSEFDGERWRYNSSSSPSVVVPTMPNISPAIAVVRPRAAAFA